MESWEKPISSSHHRHPSFSSTLLDQIYRSIDDSPTLESTTRKKKHHRNSEDRQISPAYHRRSIAVDFERSKRTIADSVFLGYSNSSSSDSSGLSSSESDSLYGRSKSSASPRQPKPIRTSLDYSGNVQKPKELGGFLRTKSKALKIYTDLKKVKQPISPCGRLATFLNSLFTNAATNSKKHKKINTAASAVAEPHSSTCFSASSLSRSCLSKTPSSSGKSKRSVRFCPVNVILDEDSSIPMPYPRLYDRHVMEEENRRVIEAAKDLLRTYHKNKTMTTATCDDVEEEDDDC